LGPGHNRISNSTTSRNTIGAKDKWWRFCWQQEIHRAMQQCCTPLDLSATHVLAPFSILHSTPPTHIHTQWEIVVQTNIHPFTSVCSCVCRSFFSRGFELLSATAAGRGCPLPQVSCTTVTQRLVVRRTSVVDANLDGLHVLLSPAGDHHTTAPTAGSLVSSFSPHFENEGVVQNDRSERGW
jgi:hypothetical protein